MRKRPSWLSPTAIGSDLRSNMVSFLVFIDKTFTRCLSVSFLLKRQWFSWISTTLTERKLVVTRRM